MQPWLVRVERSRISLDTLCCPILEGIATWLIQFELHVAFFSLIMTFGQCELQNGMLELNGTQRES